MKYLSISALALASTAIGAPGCILDPVDFTGLSCPCAEGWLCDETTNTCVQTLDDICGRSGADPGVVDVSTLRVDWTTPNQARLAWEAANVDALFTYEVDIAASEQALVAGELLRTVDSEENPELARGYLPNTSDLNDVLETTLRELDPDTAYWLRLVAIDTSGGVTCTNIAPARTSPAAVEELPMAQEAPEGANPLPTCVELVDSPETAATGSAHWEHTVRCEETAPDVGTAVCTDPANPFPRCWENVRIQGVDYPISLTESEFQHAFLEMKVEIVDTDDGFWGELGLTTRGTDTSETFIKARLTLPSSVGYQRYQIPLRILRSGGTWLTAELLARGVRGFRVGTLWRDGATVRVDDAAIRW